jgi:hypothetical protein
MIAMLSPTETIFPNSEYTHPPASPFEALPCRQDGGGRVLVLVGVVSAYWYERMRTSQLFSNT